MNIAFSLLVANTFGFLTGEWKGAGKGPIAIMSGGVLCLVLAMRVLASAGA